MSDIYDPIEGDFLGEIGSNGQATTYFESVEYGTEPDPIPEPDTPPEPVEKPFADATNPVGDGACVVCGSPTFRPPGLTASGRKKRIPKHCDLHAPHLRISSARSRVDGVESESLGSSQLQRIQDELADDFRLLGMLAGPLMPVTGMYLYEQSDPFTIAIIKLCKNNQRALRVLHRAAQIAPIYTVAETLAGTAYAVQVDLKGADPHNTIAKRLKVERAYNTVHPEEQDDQYSSSQTFTMPPRYAGVQ